MPGLQVLYSSVVLLSLWLGLTPPTGASTVGRLQNNFLLYLPYVAHSAAAQSCAPVELVRDGGFEAGLPNPAWQTSSNMFSDILDNTPAPVPHAGSWKAWLGGDDNVQESLWQELAVPPGEGSLRVSYWWQVDTLEMAQHPFDTLEVQIRDAAGNPLQTLEALSDGNAGPTWQQSVFTVTQTYAGQTIQLAFVGQTDGSNPTSFFLDDVSVVRLCPTGQAGN